MRATVLITLLLWTSGVGAGDTLSGRVVAAESELPVPGTQVELVGRAPGVPERVLAEAYTDSRGRYVLDGREVPSVVSARLRFRVAPRLPLEMEVPSGVPTVRLKSGRVVAGRVLLPGGGPAVGARVYAIHDAGNLPYLQSDPDLRISRLSFPVNATGRFQAWVPRGRCTLLAVAPGHAPTYAAPVRVGVSPTPPVEIQLRTGNSLRGQVVDDAGEGVAAALVRYWRDAPDEQPDRWLAGRSTLQGEMPAGYPIVEEVVTESDGTFQLVGLRGPSVRVAVSHPGHLPETGVLHVDAGRSVVRVHRARVLRVQGWNDRWGRPRLFEHRGDRTGSVLYRDARGYRTPPLASFAARGWLGTREHQPVAVQWPVGSGPWHIELWSMKRAARVTLPTGWSRHAQVHGRIRRATGEPVAGGMVVVKIPGHAGPTVHIAHSDATGHFRLGGLPARESVEVHVQAPPPFFAVREARIERLSPGSRHDLGELRLPAAGNLRGRVLDENGVPVAGVRIEVLRDPRYHDPHRADDSVWSATSDRRGRYRIAGVATGSVTVTAIQDPPRDERMAWALARSTSGEVFVIGADAAELNLTLPGLDPTARRGTLKRCTLHDPAGRPVSGARVTIEPGRVIGEGITDDAGRFQVEAPLGPRLRVSVQYGALRQLRHEFRFDSLARMPARLDLPPAGETELELEIRFADPAPAPRHWQATVEQEGAVYWSATGREASSRLRARFLKSGAATVHVRADGYRPWQRTVELERGGVPRFTVRLTPWPDSQRFQLTVLDESGAPVAGAEVHADPVAASSDRHTDRDGRAELHVYDPSVTLEIRSPGYTAALRPDVRWKADATDETRRLTVTLKRE